MQNNNQNYSMDNLRMMNPDLYDKLYPEARNMANHLRSVYPEGYQFNDKVIDGYANSLLDRAGYFDAPAVMAAADPRGSLDSRGFARSLLSGLLFDALYPYDYSYYDGYGYPYYPVPVYPYYRRGFGGGYRHGGGHRGRR